MSVRNPADVSYSLMLLDTEAHSGPAVLTFKEDANDAATTVYKRSRDRFDNCAIHSADRKNPIRVLFTENNFCPTLMKPQVLTSRTLKSAVNNVHRNSLNGMRRAIRRRLGGNDNNRIRR